MLWHSGTWGNPDATLVVQNDGNVVLYRERAKPSTAVWYTGWDR
ncbi:hypothetical protein SAMN06264364_1872 [Quadrisphaera granulorum]|uniref:Bulb-type lectin domain-containing protein n=1 Tax=Quadrisphaera granulorum TaxID=317664 RepID=A0A315Z7B4_9ACTN|nr:hypothetical protein BXY45_1872 [Quadrisphaera granulorum]SZE99248.1 hypothetical protein SAMN06264364_1872 [Quadrisphaera granulorum]